MSLGLTRGEMILVMFIFALIYGAGLLPKIANLLAPGEEDREAPPASKRE